MPEHARRRRVNEAGRVRERVGERAAGAQPRVRKARLQLVGKRARAHGVDVEERELRGAHRERRVRDGRARAARAKLHDALERRARQPARERLREARPIGVVADAPAVREAHRVDRAERGRVRRQFVEMLDHPLLARMRDVQPVEAHPFGGREQLGQRVGRQPQRVEIDAPVHVVQTLPAPLRLVHRGRQRAADPGADQADQKRTPAHRAPSPPISVASRRSANT
ncbi:hypothetical protein JT30_4656 [Burkholderia pseudomallei]|nr:hypothetical protein JT30_4656 [Burkholderia pseudomallei]